MGIFLKPGLSLGFFVWMNWLDLAAYQAYFEGKLKDYEYPQEKIEEALKSLPEIKGS